MDLDPQVTAARTAANQAQSRVADFASKSFTIGDELKQAVQEALDYNKDVIGLRSSALSTYLKSPSDAASKFGVETFETGEQAGQRNQDFIFNPFERNKAINDFISNQEVPFMNWNTILGMREGTIGEMVEKGTNAFKAQAAATQAAAAAAQQTYSNVLNEFLKGQELAQQNRALDIQEYSARKSGGGASRGLSEMDLYEMSKAKNQAYGMIASVIGSEAGPKTEAELRASIYNQGYDPADPFFSSLYSQLPVQKKPVSIGERLKPVGDFFKNTGSAIMDYLNKPGSSSYPYLTPGMFNNLKAPSVRA